MKYEQLKNFILNEMKMQEGKNYQPVMIRYLNQNRGKATKKDIQEALHNANPEYPAKYFQDSPVFDVLTTSHQVADYNSKEDTYNLFDYDTFTPAQKAHITMYCDDKIRDSANPINPRIILFSVAGKKSYEHFNETITTDVVTNTLPGSTILKNFQAVRVWGSIFNAQNFSKWKELKKGDILLFYHNKKYITSAFLDGTEQNQELADHLWGYKDDESKKTFELMMYMSPSSVFDEDVDYQKLNRLLGYEEEFMPTRILDFTTVNKNKTDELIVKFGSLENALKTIGFSFPVSESIFEDLEHLILKFDKNRNYFHPDRELEEERNKICNEFVANFSIEKLKTMKITEYVLGNRDPDTGEPDRTTFSYMLEMGILGFGGIGGTPASKFGIYFNQGKNQYAIHRDFDSPESAFEAVRNDVIGIVQAGQEFVQDKDWQKLSDAIDNKSDHIIASHVRSKILSVYFPNDCLDIHGRPGLKKLLDYFRIDKKDIQDKLTLMQSKLLDIKKEHPIMNEWSIQDYSHLIWNGIVNDVVTSDDYDSFQDEPEPVSGESDTSDKSNINYLLFYRSPPGKKSHAERNKWDDVLGHEYPYGKRSGATSAVTPGSKAVWMFTENDEIYFWGHGEIESNKETGKDKFLATMKGFERLGANNEPKKASASLREKIQLHKGWNKSNAVMDIGDTIYNEIVNDEEYMEDENLEYPTGKLKSGIEKIQEELLIDDDVIKEIVIHLASKRHVLLAGPVGTGKTRLSQLIPQVFWSKNGGYYPEIHTATADWSTQDVIGGIMPKVNPDNPSSPTYDIENGCVTSTILYNFNEENAKTDQFDRQPRARSDNDEEKTYHGTWLVIDEFNRADIDKAFGQLFTALEYGKLKVPSNTNNKSFREIPIPKDYRIIGTMNTADKHYLFNLSDALKRRFAYVEVPVPKRTPENKKKEIFLALKNALKELDNDYSDIVKISKSQLSFKKPSDKVGIKTEQAYAVMEIVRVFKPLGTAILKSIFQTLMVSEKMKEKNSLDRAINANLVPQLESLQKTSLEIIDKLLFGNPAKFFKELEQPERYSTEMALLLSYLDYNEEEIKTKLMKFNENDFKKNISDLEKRLEKKMAYLKLTKITDKNRNSKFPIFSESVKEMIKQSEFI